MTIKIGKYERYVSTKGVGKKMPYTLLHSKQNKDDENNLNVIS